MTAACAKCRRLLCDLCELLGAEQLRRYAERWRLEESRRLAGRFYPAYVGGGAA